MCIDVSFQSIYKKCPTSALLPSPEQKWHLQMMHCCLQMCSQLHSILSHPMPCTHAHDEQNVLFMMEWTLWFDTASVTTSDQVHIFNIAKNVE